MVNSSKRSPKLIPEIPIPNTIQRNLIAIQNEMMKTWKKKKGWDFTSGYMPKPELDSNLDFYWETFGAICDLNKVIENLNLVINDIYLIANRSETCSNLLNGKLSTRYHLLVRTFFYELFRTKEIYNKYLKYFKKTKLLRKTDVLFYQTRFRQVFDDFFEIRNKMIHDRYVFQGEDHYLLWMSDFLNEKNMAVASRETGEITETLDVLKRLYEEFSKMAIPVGIALVKYFEDFSNAACETFNEVNNCDSKEGAH